MMTTLKIRLIVIEVCTSLMHKCFWSYYLLTSKKGQIIHIDLLLIFQRLKLPETIHICSLIFVMSISSFQSLSHVPLLVTPQTAAYQASMSITSSQNLLKCMSIESVMPSNHPIFSFPLLLLS